MEKALSRSVSASGSGLKRKFARDTLLTAHIYFLGVAEIGGSWSVPNEMLKLPALQQIVVC